MESMIALLLMTVLCSQTLIASPLQVNGKDPDSLETRLSSQGSITQQVTPKVFNQDNIPVFSPENALDLFPYLETRPTIITAIRSDSKNMIDGSAKVLTSATNGTNKTTATNEHPNSSQSYLSLRGRELTIGEELEASQSVRQERGLYGDDYGFDRYSDLGDHGGYKGYGGYKGQGGYGSKGQSGFSYGGQHGTQQGYSKGYSKGYEHKYSHAYGDDYGQGHKNKHGYGQQLYGYGNGGYGGYGHGLYGHGGYHGYGHHLLGGYGSGLGGLYGGQLLGDLRGGFLGPYSGLLYAGIGGLGGYGGHGIGGLGGYGGYRNIGYHPWYGYYG